MVTSPRLFDLDSIMIDIVLRVSELPQRGSDALSSQHLVTTGGGFNTMSAAARHGMRVVYAGRLGTGPFSDIAREALRGEQVAAPITADPNSDVGFCIVLVDAEGERTFVTATGAERGLSVSDLEVLDVAPGDYVVISGYNIVYRELGAAVIAWLDGVSDDLIIAFDPGARVMEIGAAALRAVLQRTDWLFCNANEAAWLSQSDTPEDAAVVLKDSLRRGVVIHDGAAGCVVAARDAVPFRVKGYAVNVVDTNGAGDIHNGVFLSEVARGTALVEAAQRANAAAAIAISELGPSTCPSREAVSQWFAQFS